MTDMFVSTKMCKWIVLLVIVFVAVKAQNGQGQCVTCTDKEYECDPDRYCDCPLGWTLHWSLSECVRCPGLGQWCENTCCDSTLSCWNNMCTPCLDAKVNPNCSKEISTIQLILIIALILGVITVFTILFNRCAAVKTRPLDNGSNNGIQQSAESVQTNVDERLRDAPPRYSIVPSSTAVSANAYTNTSFVPDYYVPRTPPPQYSEAIKMGNRPNTALHI